MTLNFKYVVYESCRLDDLTIEKLRGIFFVKNFQVLAHFLLRKMCIHIFLLHINQYD